MKKTILIATSTLSLTAAGAVSAAPATATTDLNLRVGPGPGYEIASVIPADGAVEVMRCVETAAWCEVTYDGTTGWAYGEYLTASLPDAAEPVVVYDNRPALQVETVTIDNAVDNTVSTGVGAGAGAAAGALIGGPVGAAFGTVIGAAFGDAQEPDQETVAYVRENPVDPVTLQGEVVVGAGLPETVTLAQVPNATVGYAYINGTPVLVEPSERRIVYVVR